MLLSAFITTKCSWRTSHHFCMRQQNTQTTFKLLSLRLKPFAPWLRCLHLLQTIRTPACYASCSAGTACPYQYGVCTRRRHQPGNIWRSRPLQACNLMMHLNSATSLCKYGRFANARIGPLCYGRMIRMPPPSFRIPPPIIDSAAGLHSNTRYLIPGKRASAKYFSLLKALVVSLIISCTLATFVTSMFIL